MAEAHLDHPGDIRWFKGWGPAPVLGPCPHESCTHWGMSVIAHGPDFEHYELVRCTDEDGCAGECRGWFGEWPVGHVPRYRPPEQWLHVPRPAGTT